MIRILTHLGLDVLIKPSIKWVTESSFTIMLVINLVSNNYQSQIAFITFGGYKKELEKRMFFLTMASIYES